MNRRNPYETRTVYGQRRAARLVKKGWEVVSTASAFLAPSRITLRRPNPKHEAR